MYQNKEQLLGNNTLFRSSMMPEVGDRYACGKPSCAILSVNLANCSARESPEISNETIYKSVRAASLAYALRTDCIPQMSRKHTGNPEF